MKTIKMDYSEYESMVKLIKEQDEIIKEFKKESRVVLIDERSTRYSYQFNISIPHIISTDEELAKEFLKEEFDTLLDRVDGFNEVVNTLKEQNKTQKIKTIKPKKSSWWY